MAQIMAVRKAKNMGFKKNSITNSTGNPAAATIILVFIAISFLLNTAKSSVAALICNYRFIHVTGSKVRP